jgi:hypothetical protein
MSLALGQGKASVVRQWHCGEPRVLTTPYRFQSGEWKGGVLTPPLPTLPIVPPSRAPRCPSAEGLRGARDANKRLGTALRRG